MAYTDTVPSLANVDIYDSELLQNPFPFLERLRTEAPVLRHADSGIYQISSYDLASKAAMDYQTFSSDISHALHGKSVASDRVRAVMAEGYPRPQTLHTADPPFHTRSRKLVDKAFTPKRVAEMVPQIVAVVDDLIDSFAARGSVEFVSEFAQRLPMAIIATQLGVPLEDREKFLTWIDAFAAQFSHKAGEDGEVEAARHVVAFQKYFAEMLEEKRARPTDDIISVIANATLAEEGDDRPLEVPEALQIIQQLLAAGNETTVASMAEGMRLFLQQPGTVEALASSPEVLSRGVEEVLRLLSPVQNMWRVATRDVELGGVMIPEGALVLVRFGSANRDATIFANGESFDLDRANGRRHVAFGYGIHACIGAALARKELNIGFQRLFERIKGWRIAPHADLTYNSSILLRGLRRLDLEFDPVRT